MPSTTAPTAPATEKQIAYLRKLLAERTGVSAAEHVRDALNSARTDGPISKALASSAIETLLKLPKAEQAPRPQATTTVPEGHYATASRTGSNDLDFWRVDRPTEGRWAGRVFVKRVIGGRADQAVRGAEQAEALAAIEAAGPAEAMAAYGQAIGRCGRCNRHLTDEASRARGLGPDCAGMV